MHDVRISFIYIFLSPRTTSCGIQNLTCSSGQPWVEKIIVSQLYCQYSLCPSPRFNSILDRLPDLSSQSRVHPFCPRRWPGSVCVDHRHELQRFSRPIQALRPLADQFKPMRRHRMRWITASLIFPSETGSPVLFTTVARICMSRPPPRITEDSLAHPGPSTTCYSEFDASSRLLFSEELYSGCFSCQCSLIVVSHVGK